MFLNASFTIFFVTFFVIFSGAFFRTVSNDFFIRSRALSRIFIAYNVFFIIFIITSLLSSLTRSF